MSLQTVVEDCLRGLGYELVELDWQAGGHLRVFIEHAVGGQGTSGGDPTAAASEGPIPEDGSGIRIEDCERASHQLSHVLMVEDVDYARLEVSSPGLDRPLRRRADFERFAGSAITLKLRFAVGGRRNFEGVLNLEESGQFALEVQLAQEAPLGHKSGKAASKARNLKVRRVAAKTSAMANGEHAGAAPRLVFSLEDVERARLVPKLKFRDLV